MSRNISARATNAIWPIIYYGDEIGMGDNIYLGDRNGVRTPMQWTPDRNGGFSRADPARLYAPPIMDPLYGYEAVNVEAQSRSLSSLLSWTKRLISVRKSNLAFGRGTMTFIRPVNRAVLAYVRDRKSTRLNSSHSQISYAVFCLKKKTIYVGTTHQQHWTVGGVKHIFSI